MSKLVLTDFESRRPVIQMAPLVDIIFLTLVFFMTLSIFNQLESELNISVPKAKESKEAIRSPGEIIINVNKSGKVVVNQKELSTGDLQKMLKKIALLFPDQPVIIRADQETYHKYIVKVLDACASADIWNISFSTLKKE
ncbi:MAG: biopolymer transporter ExbD [Candidatus Omnitrophica bacterium]|nr:biopolymer transporter ExbD [Candidatus Omnitrophota bacterium]